MVFTDPPYNVPIDGNVSGLGAVRHREFAMASGEMSQAEFTGFLTRALSLHARHSGRGFAALHLHGLAAYGVKCWPPDRAVYSELKNLCVWAKDNAGMGSLYRSQHELVFVFKHGRGLIATTCSSGNMAATAATSGTIPAPIHSHARAPRAICLRLHPTVKPVALVADAIMDCTSRRDIVLDGFLGSGTTVIAAERSGRRCYGLEIDPLYIS